MLNGRVQNRCLKLKTKTKEETNAAKLSSATFVDRRCATNFKD